MYPICHIGMTKSIWRKIMELNKVDYKLDGESVMKKVKEVLGNSYVTESSSWYADQKIISILIKKYEKNVSVQKIKYKGNRLDRSLSDRNWTTLLNEFESITDLHSFKENIFEKWSLVSNIFFNIFNSEIGEFLRKYRFEYLDI